MGIWYRGTYCAIEKQIEVITTILRTINETGRAAKLGHGESISLLYDAYAPMMYGQIFKIVADKKRAENILESVFINLSATIENYNKKRSSLFIWLLNTARNAAIEALNDHPVKKDTINYQFPVTTAELII